MKKAVGITKMSSILIVISALLLIAVIYIINDYVSDFKKDLEDEYIKTGRREAISEIITQASNEDCQSVTIYMDERRVDVVNIECLNSGQNTASESVPADLEDSPTAQ